jgi:hypothetical protein
MDKLLVFRTLLIALMFCLLVWDVALSLINHTQPVQHRDVLLIGALLWIISVLLPRNSDDDWQLT